MLEVMREYGWDWYTYNNQPTWVLEIAHQKLVIESKLAAKAKEAQNNG